MGAVAAGMWSCGSDESAVSEPTYDGGRNVHITVTASREGNADTRTALSPDDAGNLACTWTEGDKLLVTDAQGSALGVLEMLDYDASNPSDKAVFDGDLTGVTVSEGTASLNFLYLGTEWSRSENPESVGKTVTFDYSTQNGTLTSLTDKDLLTAKSIPVSIVEKGDKQHAYSSTEIEMSRLISFAKFKLESNKAGEITEVANASDKNIEIYGENLTNKVSINLGTLTPDYSSKGNITISGIDNGEFYMVLPPNAREEEAAPAKFDLCFWVNQDQTKSYAAVYPIGENRENGLIASGKYYRKGGVADDANALTPKDTDYELIDQARNPLLKWAEGDLVYDKNTKKSSVASSYTTQGSLYQWGRNVGFIDYEDALGEKIGPISGYSFMPYYTYRNNYNTATGVLGNGNDHISFYYKDLTGDYGIDDTDYYYMNPNGDDYWVGSAFGDGGSTWQERARKCGYSSNICPNGYRLPKEEDYLEIIPVDKVVGSTSLASCLDISEIKQNAKGDITYAIHWSAESPSNKTYLRIDALVVPSKFSESQLLNIKWNKEIVKKRRFGANGGIAGFTHTNLLYSGSIYSSSGYYPNTKFTVARPMPSIEIHLDELRYWSSNGIWTVLWTNITDLAVNNIGFYWMDDKSKVFAFQDNSRLKNIYLYNLSSGQIGVDKAFPEITSYFGIANERPQSCYAIRCIDTSVEAEWQTVN